MKTLNSMRMAACIINVWGCAKHRLRGERRSWSSWPQLIFFYNDWNMEWYLLWVLLLLQLLQPSVSDSMETDILTWPEFF